MDVLFATYMKATLLIAALSSANFGQAASVTKTFTPMTDTTILFNPERGFYKALSLSTATDFLPSLSISNIQSMISNDQINSSIILVEIFLDNFITSNISSNVLEKMNTVVFPAIRSLSVKCLVRFAYTNAIIKVNDVVGVQDAVETQVVKHIQQLAPILQANSDVIFVVQAGFIGAYGEWFFTNNFASPVDPEIVSTAQQAARNRIVEALLKAVPSNRMIQLRTPSYKQIYCNTVANLKSEEAFSSSIPCARIGIHNDCFLAPSGDQGTFLSDDDRVWLTNEALYVMTGGESCMLNGNETSCAGGIAQVKAQGFTYLNTDYHDDVIAGWVNNGCYKAIANMLGYRFQLVSGTFPTSVTRGMNYQATISVSNTGVAPLYNARSVQVILRNRATRALSIFPQSAIDLRRWAPRSITTVPLSFLVPLSLISGIYDVILNLPDASTSLANQPAARILFANGDDVQEADTRYNILGQVTVV